MYEVSLKVNSIEDYFLKEGWNVQEEKGKNSASARVVLDPREKTQMRRPEWFGNPLVVASLPRLEPD